MFTEAFIWHFVTFTSILILASRGKYITVTLKQKFWATTSSIPGEPVTFKEFQSSVVILEI